MCKICHPNKEQIFFIGTLLRINRAAIKFFPVSNIYDDSFTKTE